MYKPKTLTQCLGLAAALFVCGTSSQAQIMINEFSAANKSNYLDNYGEYEDWIELYNAGATSVNLQGYYLSDEVANPTQWQIPAGVTIPAGGRRIFYASNRDVVVGASVHTNFKLTQMRQESVVLSDPSGNIIDQYTIVSPMQRNHSFGRETDGGANWRVYPTPTPNASNNTGTSYTRYTDKPVFDTQAGFYGGSINVTITAEPGATIRYTTDGSTPSAASTLYTGPISVPNTRIIRARAYSSDPAVLPSFPENNTYFINETFTFPVVSISSSNFTNLFNSSMGEIVSTFEYFEDGQFVQETEGDVRGHGNDSWAFPQKGMRFYVRDQYGYSNKLDHQFFDNEFSESPRTDFDVVLLKAAGSDNYPGSWGLPSCHLRDGYSQTLAEKYDLNVDVRRYQSIIIFINGQYWGVYELRERIDSDYTDYYYDQPEAYVDMLKYWGWLNVEYGSANDWDALDAFMDANSMTVPANYNYVQGELDLMSMIDYVILNTYTANSDWLNWNTAWWRGTKAPGTKWRYQLWDQDNTFDLGQNYTGIGTTTFNNSPCDVETLFQGDPDIEHTDMFVQLMQNEQFFDMYINRYADLINTAFNCDTMLAHFDAMVAALTPEMPRQITRWGGSMAGWQANLNHMRGQISGRCAVIEQSFVDCYTPQITMPQNITVDVSPAGAGNVRVNTVTPTSYPWTGAYFGGVNLSFKATANTNYVFDHWIVNNHAILPNANADSMYIQFNTADNIVAVFVSSISLAGSTTNDNCNGSGTGSITVSPTGGTSPYSFLWSNNATTQNLSNVTAGNYTVTMTDGNGNTVTQSFSVGTDPAPTLAYTTTPPACLGGANGSIDVSVSGGATPYSYAWSNGLPATEDAANLAAGTYSITVTDNSTCTVTQSISVADGDAPSVAFLANNPFCTGGNNGSINLTPAGGTAPYSFVWDNGLPATEDVTGLMAGTYNVTVSDNDNCSITQSITVTDGNSPTAAASVAEQVSCNGLSDGVFTVAPTGGQIPYTFLWSNGATTQDASGFAVGTHSVVVTDVNGCTVSASATMTEPTAMALALDISNASSGDNGSIATAVSGGTTPYTYLWNDAAAQSNTTAVNLSAGTYTVTVTDANGCTVSASGEVLAGSLDCIKSTMTITPNSDGTNDAWVIDCIFSFQNEVSVYNRWGQMVFSATNYDNTWQGTNAGGTELPDGGYFYIIRVTTPANGDEILKGAINIVR